MKVSVLGYGSCLPRYWVRRLELTCFPKCDRRSGVIAWVRTVNPGHARLFIPGEG